MQKLQFNDLSKEEQGLLMKAKEASEHYYNPRGSHYVGAALKSVDGEIFQGAAVRRQSASSNTCSERMVIDKAIYAGKRDYKTIAIVGFKTDGSKMGPVFPCGSCRQIIFEYYPEAETGSILASNSDVTEIIRTDINELLPSAYKSNNLDKK